MGLTPVEILIVAQIMEFQTKNKECFISDDVMSENFGVSKSTISRAVSALEKKGILTRQTKNVQRGKERHLYISTSGLEAYRKSQNESCESTNVKMTTCKSQNDSCGNSKLTFSKKQNESIKDNLKDKEKEKIKEEEINQPSVDVITSTNTPESPEAKEDGTANHPFKVNKEWLIERYNELYECGNGMFRYRNEFYKMT